MSFIPDLIKQYQNNRAPKLIELPGERYVLLLVPSKHIRVDFVRHENKSVSDTIFDEKSPDMAQKVRISPALDPLFFVASQQRNNLEADMLDTLEGEIIFGRIGTKMVGFHFERQFDKKYKVWQIKITHPLKSNASVYCRRAMIVSGYATGEPYDEKVLLERMKENHCEAVLLLPEGIDTNISQPATDITKDLHFTPLLDIDAKGNLYWLLPVVAPRHDLWFYVHPGQGSVLNL